MSITLAERNYLFYWICFCVSESLLLIVQVCIVNDPRPKNPYKKMYTVEYLNNMANANIVHYNNQPIEVLKSLTAESLRNNEVRLT